MSFATPTMSADSPFPAEGGCDCRAVRYRMVSAPLVVHCCHCRWCQRESGASFALNAMIEADRVASLGVDPELIDTPSESGAGQRIARCPVCKVAVWSNYAGAGPVVRFVRVGTLDNPDLLAPDVHIFTSSRQAWVQLPAGAPAFPEYYEREQVWSSSSLERRKALQPLIEAYQASRRGIPPPMHDPIPAQFMRFTAPDPEALERGIRDTRSKLSEAQSRGDATAILDHAADLGGMLTTARNEAAALELLRSHEHLASTHPMAEQVAWYWNALATAMQYTGDRAAAEACFARAVSVAREGGWRRIEAMALHHWGRSLVEQGRLDEAESCITQALAIREELGEPRQETSRKALAEMARLRAASRAKAPVQSGPQQHPAARTG